MVDALDLQDIGRIPAAGDNAAIATKRIEAGTRFNFEDREFTISHTILEGHRFAIEPINKGEYLHSWGLPFGRALRMIEPGEYLCNSGILDALRLRQLDFPLPAVANFRDHTAVYKLDEKAFRPGIQVALHPQHDTFEGYARNGDRGTGTRNMIIILGTTSLTASYAARLAALLKPTADKYPEIDAIVAVTHTEGGGARMPNNLEFVLRTLAGFMVHPNVGAVLAVDYGMEAINNVMLEKYLRDHGYPIDHVLHRFYSLDRDFEAALKEGEKVIRSWLAAVNEMRRSVRPLSELRIALQCGGSDAFSGVAGNPLAGCVAKEVIRHGGSANLAETDELIGAEPYILANTRDADTARHFLDKIAIFKERVAWHGHSAEGNPSGGNKFRGLYNIAIKSIGAARKKDPEVRLDYVIDYGQPMTEPGFYFMDSPGNDLESIAGQIAAGCNMIFFITGNGSITNFPFVPTIKFITTSGRWRLLSQDMDINAGRYQDGTPLEELAEETFKYTIEVASGMRSVGERAGHSQVSIWRDWCQTDKSQLPRLLHRPVPTGNSIPVDGILASAHDFRFQAQATTHGFTTDQVALIVPTSLCSGQIARKIVDDLNERNIASGRNISRFVTLVHTEGCGVSGGENEDHYTRVVVGHLLHPFVREALLLEHGCERTHNDLIHHVLKQYHIDPDRFGYASIQLDGGIDKVVDKIEGWFGEKLPMAAPVERTDVGLEAMSLGLLCTGPIGKTAATALAWITRMIVGGKGTVVIPQNTPLLESPVFLTGLGWNNVPGTSLEYGQFLQQSGLHIMAAPTEHAVETLTGLGGTGIQILLAHVAGPPLQGHPMIPLLQITSDALTTVRFSRDLDHLIDADDIDCETVGAKLLQLICATASQTYRPRLWGAGNTDFQLARGRLGVSL